MRTLRQAVAALVLVVLSLLSGRPEALRADDAAPGALVVTFLDIGQGDCTLIETPDGKAILIDGGEGKIPDAAELYPSDAGTRVVLPVLKKKGIRTLDLVIATHPHSDHIGGLLEVLADPEIAVKELWDSGCTSWDYPAFKKLKEIVKARAVPVVTPKEGQTYPWGKDVSATVLHVQPDATDVNDASIVVRVVHGKASFLLTGDAEKEAEAMMVFGRKEALASTVLKVGHHGSKTSSNPPFVAAVKPKFAVISCGDYNTYGHPRPEPQAELKKAGAEIHRTDLEGHVEARSDGKTVTLRTSQGGGLDLPRATSAGQDSFPRITAAEFEKSVGKWVRLRGKVSLVKAARGKAPAILTIEGSAPVVVFNDVAERMEKAGMKIDGLEGKTLEITGFVKDDKKYGIQMVLRCPRFVAAAAQ